MIDPKDSTDTWTNVPRCYTLCAWCGWQIRDGDRSSGPSHGICPGCLETYFPAEYAKMHPPAPGA